MTEREHTPNDSEPRRSQPGRTAGNRWLLAIGTLSLGASAIEGSLKGLTGVLKEVGGVFQQVKSLTDLLKLPWSASWILVVGLGVFGIWLLYLGGRKKSRLLRPEALVIRADDPSHLWGREDDLRKLAHICRDRSLVFLVGESGAGKSALVRAGLCQPGGLPPQMVPLLVEGWGEDWIEGPSRRLAEALRSLAEDEGTKLELAPGAKLAGTLTAVKRFKAKLGRTPLLIFDQFDDYQVRHLLQFRDAETGSWKTTTQVMAENPFWEGIAELIRGEYAHVLIVTRSDMAAGLFAVQFLPEPCTYALDRPSASVVKPLLDQLTGDSQTKGAVVSDPENGWDQLQERLARDLEQDGQVLPIQLRSALAGLASLPRLTVAAYQRAGGVQGLEAAAVETLVAGAARHSGLKREGVLRVLKALVDVRDRKTVPRPSAKLERIDGTNANELRKALEFLETNELVRRVPNSDDNDISWRLDHDYQSNAIIAAEKRSDCWNMLLRDSHQAWREARGDLRKRWQTLLPPHRQTALLWWRLRGRCRFGTASAYWWLSTLRAIPYLAIVAVCWFLAVMYQDQRDEAQARSWFAVVGLTHEATADEMERCFWPLALEPREGVRWHFLKIGLERPENAERLRRRADLVAQAAVGVNARYRSRVIDELLSRKLSEPARDSKIVLACAALGQSLHAGDHHETMSASLRQALVEAVKGETDPRRRLMLARAFAAVAGKATPEQNAAVAQALVEAMKQEVSLLRLSELAQAFAAVAGEAAPEQAAPEQAAAVVQALVEAVKGETDPNRRCELAQALAAVAGKATPEQAAAVAQVFVEAVKEETDPNRRSVLARAFAAVARKGTPKHIAAVARVFVEAVKGETDPNRRSVLARAFAAVAGKAAPEQAAAVAQALVEAVKGETDPPLLYELAQAFAAVAGKLTPMQSRRLFRDFADAMQLKSESKSLDGWGLAIKSQAEFLDPSDLANVLKYPNCVGPVRSAVLEKLAKALKVEWQPTDDPWRILSHDKLKAYVNLPLVRPPGWPAK